MGKIKKILENELVGGTQSTDVYPITSTKAIYDENNERLDNVLEKKFDKVSVVQESGEAEDKVMSQKAVIEAIAVEKTRAKEAEENLDNKVTDLGLKVSKVETEAEVLSLYDKIFDTANNKIEYSNVKSTINGTCDIKKGSVIYVKFSGFNEFSSTGQLVIKVGNDFVIPATADESGENFCVLADDATSYKIFVGGIPSTARGGNVKILSKSSPEFLNDILSNKKEIDNLRVRLSILDLLYGEYKSYSISPRGYYYNKNGEQKYATSSWATSGFIKVSRGSKISYKINTMASSEVSFIGYKIGTEYVDLTSSSQGEFVAENDIQLQVTSLARATDPTDYYLKVSVFNEQKSTDDTFGKNVNWVGMSIWWYEGHTLASGHMGGEIARGYQTLLKEQFDFLSDTGTNYCYSGNSLGATAESDSYCIMNHSTNWQPSDNAIWTLDSITNDFKRNIPIGSYANYANKTGLLTYYGALREFADKVTSLSGDDAIVVCSNALRRNNGGYTSTSQNTQGHTLKDYEHALMDIASRNHWYFVDQFRLSGVTDDSIDLTTIDGLHLNNFGYTLAVKPWIEMFNIIKNVIKQE